MVVKKVYQVLALLSWLIVAAGEPPDTLVQRNQTSVLSSEVYPDPQFPLRDMDILSVRMVESLGTRLDEDTTGLRETLREKREVKASVAGRLRECWWTLPTEDDLDGGKTVECVVERSQGTALIRVLVESRERRRLDTCLSTQYWNISTNACLTCDVSCASCTGPDSCIECAANYEWLEGETTGLCAWMCINDCDECTDNTTCTMCRDGYGWDSVSNACELLVCSPTCATCQGTPDNCTTCSPCTHFPFLNMTAGVCDRHCPANCKTCDSDITCTECAPTYVLNSSSLCESASTPPPPQLICDPMCSTCSGIATNCTECASCFHFPLKDMIFGTCSRHCPPACVSCDTDKTCTECAPTYVLNSSSLCESAPTPPPQLICDPMCSTCSGIATNCTECASCFHFPLKDMIIGTCSRHCPPACVSCDTDKTCTECAPTYVLNSSSLCESAPTPPPQLICDPMCSTCSGIATNCTECASSFHFPTKDMIFGTCSSQCPPACVSCDTNETCTECAPTYVLNSSSLCESAPTPPPQLICDPMCSTCSGIATNCTECASCFHFPLKDMIFGTCSRHCPPACVSCDTDETCTECEHTYVLNSSSLCEPVPTPPSQLICDPMCSTCEGIATNCTECAICFHFPIKGMIFGACSRHCPSACVSCDTDETCTECAPTYVLNSSSLCESAPTPPPQLICDPMCSTCEGIATNCTECASCFHFPLKDMIFGTCSRHCPPACVSCDTDKTCTECAPTYVLNSSSLCESAPTPPPQLICDPMCSTCSGIPTNCTACASCFHFPIKGMIFGTCSRHCPPACVSCDTDKTCTECAPTFVLNSSSLCESAPTPPPQLICDPMCSTCEGIATNCTVCASCFHFPIKDMIFGTCSRHCPPACVSCDTDKTCTECAPTYVLNSSSLCESAPTPPPQLICDPMCSTCSGIATNCTECASCFHFPLKGMIFGTCSRHCPPACVSCDTDKTCTECAPNYALNDSSLCELVPPDPPITCAKMCNTCSGIATNCTECASCFHFPIKGVTFGTCTRHCPPKCNKCDSDITCVECASGFNLNPDTYLCEACTPSFHCAACTQNACNSCDSADWQVVPNSLDCECVLGDHCKTCGDLGCTSCSDASWHTVTGSYACMPNPCTPGIHCQSCDAASCLVCDSGWESVSNSMDCACTPGSNCIACDATGCTTCTSANYHTVSGEFDCACTPGVNCSTCDSTGCTQCSDTNHQTMPNSFDCTCNQGLHCSTCSASECTECDSASWHTVSGEFDCSCTPGFNCSSCDSTGCTLCSSTDYHSVSGEFDCACTPGLNCSTCDSSGCTSCSSTDWQTVASSYDCTCIPGLLCSTCDSTGCTLCSDTYHHTTPGSFDCACTQGLHCSACSILECTACDSASWHTVSGAFDCSCTPGLNCSSCDSTGCTLCSSTDYHTVSGEFDCACTPGLNCSTCDSSGCTLCSSTDWQIVASSYDCTCIPGLLCSTCDSTGCTLCSDTYHHTTPGSFDCACTQGLHCSACSILECTACDSASWHTVSGAFDCSCTPGLNCSSCDSTGCTLCSSTDYHTVASSYDCVCTPGLNCSTCDSTGCTQCSDTYHQTMPNSFDCVCNQGLHCSTCSTSECTECDSTSWHTVSGEFDCSCTPGLNCSSCDSTGCTLCSSTDYHTVSGKFDCACTPGLNCSTCDSSGCTLCSSPDWHTVASSYDCVCTPGSNCITCNSTSCTTCQQNWHIASGSLDCLPDTCTPGNQCTSCAGVQCLNCANTWQTVPNSLDCSSTSCTPGLHCITCLNSNCLTCDSNWQPVAGTLDCSSVYCTQGQHCLTCERSSCLSCEPSWHIVAGSLSCSSDSCTPGNNCITCNGANCLICEENWHTVAGTLDCSSVSCNPGYHCLTCGSGACLTCDPNWHTVAGSLSCSSDDCNPGFHCTTCSPTSCVTCNYGWIVSAGSMDCVPAPCVPGHHCKTCDTPTSQCTTCDASWQTVTGSLDCSADNCTQGFHCVTCQGVNCLTCDSAWHVVANSLDCSNNDCIPGNNCITCEENTCLTCALTWHTVTKSLDCSSDGCVAGNSCITCQGSTCLTCLSGWHPVSNSLDCTSYSCTPGYNCITCNSDTCLTCQPSWHPVPHSLSCSNDNCSPGVHCQTCSGSSCLTCDNHWQTVTGLIDCVCTPGSHCSQCSGNTCTTCDPYYHAVSGQLDCVATPCTLGLHCQYCDEGSCLSCDAHWQPVSGSLDCKCVPGARCTSCNVTGCTACISDEYHTVPGSFECACSPGNHCSACSLKGCTHCDSANWMTAPGSYDCSCIPGNHCSSCGETGCSACDDPAYHAVVGLFDCCGNLCASCSSSACELCEDPTTQEIVPGTLTCRVKCTTTEYRDVLSGFCISCGSGCQSCSSSTSCDVCITPEVQVPSVGVNACEDIVTCASAQYKVQNVCYNCDVSCATCSTGMKCDTCATGYQIQGTGQLCLSSITCPNGEWNNAGTCSTCDQSCSTCASATGCLICNQNYVSQGSGLLCLLQCSSAQYRDPISQSCEACDQSCVTCSDLTTCVQCSNGYFATSLPGACTKCDISCQTCSESATNCQTCSGSLIPVTSLPGLCTSSCDASCNGCTTASVTCSQCVDGYYASGTLPGICLPCASPCLTCITTSTTCLSCIQNYFPQSVLPGVCTNLCSPGCSTCVSSPLNCLSCSAGYYSTSLPGNCLPCSSSCLTCADSSTMCTSCNSGFLPVTTLPGTCAECDTSCQTCSGVTTNCVACTPGYFFNGASPGPCSPCDSRCDLCTDTATNCLQCAISYYPSTSLPGTCTNVCDTSCKHCSKSAVLCDVCTDGYFAAGAFPALCTLCDKTCATCSGAATYCTVCGTSAFPVSALPGQCTNTCDASCISCSPNSVTCIVCAQNFFPSTSLPGACINVCDPSCASCSQASTNCSSCATNYFPTATLPGKCTNICDVSCNGCSGSSTTCTACATAYFPYDLTSGKCVPTGSCQSNCKDNNSCSSAYTLCTACASGYTLQGTVCATVNCYQGCATCVGTSYTSCLSCLPSYQLATGSTICEYLGGCTQSCSTCYGPGSDQCLTCKPNSFNSKGTNCVCNQFYNYNAVTGNCDYVGACDSTCVSCSGPYASNCLSCPVQATLSSGVCTCNSLYQWNSASLSCAFIGQCDPTCVTCTGSKSTECATCPVNAVLASGSCSCSTGLTWTTVTNTCIYTGVCDLTCKTCTGSGQNECITCSSPLLALTPTNQCICAANYTWSVTSTSCVYSGPCAAAYSTCTGPTAADGLTCDSNAYLNSNICICKPLFTWSTTINKCAQSSCNQLCVLCSDLGANDCLSCNSVANQALTTTGTCGCAVGYYGVVQSSTDVCSPCDPSCATCTDAGATFCTSCKANSTLSLTRTCDCNAGYYWDTTLKVCANCDAACAACSGNLPTECTACLNTFTLSASECLCLAGTLLDSVFNTCKTCDLTCATCSGFSSSECLTCGVNQSLVGGSCVCTAIGFFNYQGTCTPCYAGCKTCTGPGSTQCLSCYNTAVLLSQPGPSQCTCITPLKPAPTPQVCSPCPDPCTDCSIADVNFCTSCKANAVAGAGTFPSPCVCTPGFYYDTTNLVCAPCHSSCSTCTGGSPLNCLSCNGYSNMGGLFCENYCPTTFSGIQGACTASSSTATILDLPLNTLLSPLNDTVNNYLAYSGSVDKTSPYVVYQQGMQLAGTHFVSLPSNTQDHRDIILPSTFFIEIWARPTQVANEACLISKVINTSQILSLCMNNGAFVFTTRLYQVGTTGITQTAKLFESGIATDSTLTGGAVTTTRTLTSSPFIRTWTQVQVSIDSKISSSGIRSVDQSISVNGAVVASQNVNNTFFRDFGSSDGTVLFTLGALSQVSPALGFTGAISELLINMGLTPPKSATCGCSSCSQSGLCLLSCLSNEFMKSGSCTTCSNQCNQGCLHSTDCIQSLDPLCQIPTDFNVCSSCKTLATLSGSKCQCVKNALFNSTSNTCVCAQGYKQSGTNFCAPCLSYFQSNEVKASTNKGITMIFLNFARNLLLEPLKSCSVIFTPTVFAELGTNPICIEIGLTQIRVTLGSDFTFRSGTLDMNPNVVSSSVGACNYSPAPLAPSLTLGIIALPTAVIDAPTSYSISCGTANSGLTISGQNSKSAVTGTLLYKWDLSTEQGVLTNTYSTYSAAQNSITFPNSMLFQSHLSAILTVKDSFGNVVSATATVLITTASSLSLSIDGGNSATLTTSNSQVFTASVCQGCSSTLSIYTFLWTYPGSSPDSGISAVLQTQHNGIFTIAAGSLKTKVYQFLCTATDQENNVGTTTLTVNITSSPLVVSCNRSGGPLAPSEQLNVDCSNSTDPDNPSVSVSAFWSCVSNSTSCLDSSGKTLVFNVTSLILRINGHQMAVGMTYVFNLTILKDDRAESTSLAFSITGVDGLTIVNKENPGRRQSNQRPAVIKPVIQTSLSVHSTWGAVGNQMDKSTPPSMPFASVPANQFSNGGSFGLQLSISVQTTQVNVPVSLTINNPPIGGTFGAYPSSGVAMTTAFSFQAFGQIDPDGTDYPLTKQFGHHDKGSDKLFSEPQSGPSFSTILFSGSLSIFAKVCDSAGSCTTISASVSVSTFKRRLQATDQIALFDSQTVNPSLIPTMCVIFANTFNLTQGVWDHIFGVMNTYVDSFASLTDNQLMTYLTCYEALISVPTCQSSTNLNQIIQSVLTATAKYQDGIYDLIFTRQLEVLQNYPTSHQDCVSLEAYYDNIMSAYINTNLPQQDQFTYAGARFGTYVQRVIAPTAVSSVFGNGNFSVSTSENFLTDLGVNSDNVLDLNFRNYFTTSFPAGIVSLSVANSGIFDSLSWTSADPLSLGLVNLTNPVNLTIPITNLTALESGIQCVVFIDSSWVSQGCKVLSNSSVSVLVAASSLGMFTVVSRDVNFVLAEPLPTFPALEESEECDRYYAPVWIMVSLTGAAIIAGLFTFLVNLVIKSRPLTPAEISEPDQCANPVPLGPEDVVISLPSNQSSNQHISVPYERSGASSNLKISVPAERNESAVAASDVQVQILDERSAASSNLRISVPDERSAASSNLRIDVPEELSVGRANIVAPEQASHVSSNAHISVPDELNPSLPDELNPSAPDEQSPRADPELQGDLSRRSNHSEKPAKKSEEEESSRPEITFSEFLSGHYLLGLLLYRKPLNLLCLLTVLLSELFFLGVFYYYLAASHSSGAETSMKQLFSNYGKDDVLYYIWSFLITFIISLVLTTFFNPVRAKTAAEKKAWKTMGVVVCGIVCVFFIILIAYLNTLVCYEYAGRWSVGFLWEFITEVLIIEFVVAGYRILLLRFSSV